MTAVHPSSRRTETAPDDAPLVWPPTVGATLVRSPACPPRLLTIMRQSCRASDRAAAPAYATLTVGHEPQPVGAARRFTRWTLRDWGRESLTDNLSVIISELVTNALRYGMAGVRVNGFTAAEPVRMSLLRQGASVLCAVFDPGSALPVVKVADYLAESGRGLHVVESLSDSWGWTTPDSTGKVVWALVSSGS